MRQNDHQRQAHENLSCLATTAYHMADALGFLIQVATEANMQKIATKLAHVRVELLLMDHVDADDTE